MSKYTKKQLLYFSTNKLHQILHKISNKTFEGVKRQFLIERILKAKFVSVPNINYLALPPEIQSLVLDHMSYYQIRDLSKTCKSLRLIIKRDYDSYWKSRFIRECQPIHKYGTLEEYSKVNGGYFYSSWFKVWYLFIRDVIDDKIRVNDLESVAFKFRRANSFISVQKFLYLLVENSCNFRIYDYLISKGANILDNKAMKIALESQNQIAVDYLYEKGNVPNNTLFNELIASAKTFCIPFFFEKNLVMHHEIFKVILNCPLSVLERVVPHIKEDYILRLGLEVAISMKDIRKVSVLLNAGADPLNCLPYAIKCDEKIARLLLERIPPYIRLMNYYLIEQAIASNHLSLISELSKRGCELHVLEKQLRSYFPLRSIFKAKY